MEKLSLQIQRRNRFLSPSSSIISVWRYGPRITMGGCLGTKQTRFSMIDSEYTNIRIPYHNKTSSNKILAYWSYITDIFFHICVGTAALT